MKMERRSPHVARLRELSKTTGGILLWSVLLLWGIVALFFAIFSGGSAEASGSMQDRADAALIEHLPGRETMVKGVTDVVADFGGIRVGEVYLGEDRLLECAKPLDDASMTQTAEKLNALYGETGAALCVIAVPSASEFYGTSSLGGLTLPSQMDEIDAFYEQMVTQIRKIDVYHVLYTMTENYIYNRTDPRWTPYGAYCVYRQAIQKMGFSPISYDDYTIEHVRTYRGSLYEACLYDGVTPDILDAYICNSTTQVTSMAAYPSDGTRERREMYQTISQEDPYTYYLGEDCERIELRTNLENGRSILILKDSCANCMIPFLMQHYAHLTVLDITKMTKPLEELADPADYSQILVVCDADTFAVEEYWQWI